MEGEWLYQEDNRTHKIRATLPVTLSISKHKLSVFLDDKLIHTSKYIAIVGGEIGRLEIDGNLFVFSVEGFGIFGKLKLQINGKDAQNIYQVQVFSGGNQVQPTPIAEFISKSTVAAKSGHIFFPIADQTAPTSSAGFTTLLLGSSVRTLYSRMCTPSHWVSISKPTWSKR